MTREDRELWNFRSKRGDQKLFLWSMEQLALQSKALPKSGKTGSVITRMATQAHSHSIEWHIFIDTAVKKEETHWTHFLNDLRKHVSMQSKRYNLYYPIFKEYMMSDCCSYSFHWLDSVNPDTLQLFCSLVPSASSWLKADMGLSCMFLQCSHLCQILTVTWYLMWETSEFQNPTKTPIIWSVAIVEQLM